LLDDVADVVAGVAEVGKERGMDAAKSTAIDLFGLEGAKRKAEEFQARSLAHLKRFGPRAEWLRRLVCEASWKSS
jgi:farnesyl diphosphate synthase